MSAKEDILKKEDAPVLAQQEPEAPVTVTPPPVVDNSNVENQNNGSVQSQAQEQQQEQQNARPKIEPIKPVDVPQAKAEVQNPAGLAKPSQAAPAPKTYQDMFKELSPYTPPTQEQLEKERKNQKRATIISAISDGISSLANLYFASQGAPNMYNPDKDMSSKNRELWEKLNKERRENASLYSQGIMNAAKLDEERQNSERNYKLAVEREKNDNAQWQKHFDLQQKAQDEQAKLSREIFEHNKEQDAAANELTRARMDEATRQFDVSSQQAAERIKQEGQRLTNEIQKGQVTFALGNGKERVKLTTDALNAANVAYVFSKIPEDVRATIGTPVLDKATNRPVTVKKGGKDKDGKEKEETLYNAPTTEAMLVAIGTYVQQYPEVQDALREIAGQTANSDKGDGYSGTNKGNNRGY